MSRRTPKPGAGEPVDDTVLVGDENARLLLQQAADEAVQIAIDARDADGSPAVELHQIRGVTRKAAPVPKPRILKLMK